MGMYTELNIGVKLIPTSDVLKKLRYILGDSDEDIEIDHPLFKTPRWCYMLRSGSYYIHGQPDSKLFVDYLYPENPMYFLNVRCNLKNYDDEIELFLDWLNPYIETDGFLGYMKCEECSNPTLIYKEGNKINTKDIQ